MENNRNRNTLRKRRERKKRIRMTVTAAALAAGIGFSALAFAGIRGIVKAAAGGPQPGAVAAVGGQETTEAGTAADESITLPEPETEPVFPEGVIAGPVDLAGLTAAEAKERLEESSRWKLMVSDGENQVQAPDYLAGWLTEVTGILGNGALPEADRLRPDYEAVSGRLREFAAELADQWNRQPVNSQAESYDKATGVYTYSRERSGRTLNQEALADNLLQAVKNGRLDAVIEAEFTVQEPERTSRQAKNQYRVIGTFTTKTTDNNNRNQNIRLAAEAIDGRVLKAGEEFSFNLATGNRTGEKGYQPAGAYKNGILIEEPGGGVCQVSTTLYHAIIRSGFRTTERNAHSYAPSYVEKGQDAMVSFDGYAGPDLKFVNTGKASVVLRASFSGRELKMSIVGLPLLEEGAEVSIRSEKVRDVEPGEPVYRENPALAFGTEKTVEAPTPGSVWKSYRMLRKNGEVIEEKPLHNSTYKAKNGVVERNTTVENQTEAAVENPTEAEVESTAESVAESTVENQDGSQSQEATGAENPAEAGGPA